MILDMVERMASDRLWIYTAIVGSLLGLALSTYFQSTRLGIWLYSKFDNCVDFLVLRWGWTWLQQSENAWRKKYPHVTKKIDELEKTIEFFKTII